MSSGSTRLVAREIRFGSSPAGPSWGRRKMTRPAAAGRLLAALAGALSLPLAGCASAGGGATPDPRDGTAWTRRVAPFPVSDTAGAAYELPFLGGFNVPRPQWVDIDADGDLDLFVQESTDRLLLFERIDAATTHRYAWRPDRFADLRIGEWYRFVDVESDGDPDLLAEEPFSYMRLYHNEGEPGSPRFTLAADTLRDTAGEPIFSDRQNIPNAMDIDCDGLLDLFIGRLVGTVTRYEATGEIGENMAPFRHLTDRFEDIEIVAQQMFGSLHGANTMALADHDADGDVDMFWGDFFEAGLLLIENSGSCESPNLRNEPRPFPLDDPIATSGYNAPTFGDADGDGDLDLLLGVLGGAYNANTTTADNLLYFEHGPDGFELRTSRYLTQIDVGSESVPALLDTDGDGDLDLLLSNKIDPEELTTSRIYRFENVGSASAPVLRLAGTFDIEGAYHNAPAFGDLDGDGDLDLLLGTWRDELRLFRNDGDGGSAAAADFVLVDSAFIEITRGSNATPALGDVDGDGDLDLFVGESSGALNFYRNDGTPAEPRFVLLSDEYLGIDAGRRTAPAVTDLDGDGDLELVIGTASNGLFLYRNDGTPETPDFVEAPSPFPTDMPVFAVPAFSDIDGDGDLDLFVGGAGGGVHFFERTGG
ncbi:MAG: FG-GAP-like repeat-containing protein [Gemmatimonadota bacterium]